MTELDYSVLDPLEPLDENNGVDYSVLEPLTPETRAKDKQQKDIAELTARKEALEGRIATVKDTPVLKPTSEMSALGWSNVPRMGGLETSLQKTQSELSSAENRDVFWDTVMFEDFKHDDRTIKVLKESLDNVSRNPSPNLEPDKHYHNTERLNKIAKHYENEDEQSQVYRHFTEEELFDEKTRQKRFAELGLDDRAMADQIRGLLGNFEEAGINIPVDKALATTVVNSVLDNMFKERVLELAKVPFAYDGEGNVQGKTGFGRSVRLNRQILDGEDYVEPTWGNLIKAGFKSVFYPLAGQNQAQAEYDRQLSELAQGKDVRITQYVSVPAGGVGGGMAGVQKVVDPKTWGDKMWLDFARTHNLMDAWEGIPKDASPEEKYAAMQQAAGKELYRKQQNRENAEEIMRITGTHPIRSGFGEAWGSLGWTLQFALGGAVVGQTAMKDAQEQSDRLLTAKFNEDGSVQYEEDSFDRAFTKGLLNASVETASEFTSEVIWDAMFKALFSKLPGTDVLAKNVTKQMVKRSSGRAILRTARQMAAMGKAVHRGGVLSEHMEEVTAGFLNALFNYEMLDSESLDTGSTVGGRVREFFTPENQLQTLEQVGYTTLLLGAVGLPIGGAQAAIGEYKANNALRSTLRHLGMDLQASEALLDRDLSTQIQATFNELGRRVKEGEKLDPVISTYLMAYYGASKDVLKNMSARERNDYLAKRLQEKSVIDDNNARALLHETGVKPEVTEKMNSEELQEAVMDVLGTLKNGLGEETLARILEEAGIDPKAIPDNIAGKVKLAREIITSGQFRVLQIETRKFDKAMQLEAQRMADAQAWAIQSEENSKATFEGDLTPLLESPLENPVVSDDNVTIFLDPENNRYVVSNKITGRDDMVFVPFTPDQKADAKALQEAADRQARIADVARETLNRRESIIQTAAGNLLRNGEKVTLVDNTEQAQRYLESKGIDKPVTGRVPGLTLKGRNEILLIRDNISSSMLLMETLLHERFHLALDNLGITNEQFAKFVAKATGLNEKEILEDAEKIRKTYSKQGVKLDLNQAIEEAVAHKLETGQLLFEPSLWRYLGDKALGIKSHKISNDLGRVLAGLDNIQSKFNKGWEADSAPLEEQGEAEQETQQPETERETEQEQPEVVPEATPEATPETTPEAAPQEKISPKGPDIPGMLSQVGLTKKNILDAKLDKDQIAELYNTIEQWLEDGDNAPLDAILERFDLPRPEIQEKGEDAQDATPDAPVEEKTDQEAQSETETEPETVETEQEPAPEKEPEESKPEEKEPEPEPREPSITIKDLAKLGEDAKNGDKEAHKKLVELLGEDNAVILQGDVVDYDTATQEQLKDAEETGKVINDFPLSEVHFDPDRFQFRYIYGEKGASGALEGIKKYDKKQGGTLWLWRDPKDGKAYVVNGHNRGAAAIRLGVTHHNVAFFQAKSDDEARRMGAEMNIREGNGSALDAAKFFRETKMTLEDFEALNIPMRQSMGKRGYALAQLVESLFRKVVSGEIDESVGVAIGENLPDLNAQVQLMEYLKKQRKRDLTIGVVAEIAKIANVAVEKETKEGGAEQIDLFGEEVGRNKLILETAQVRAEIARRLGRDKRLFGMVSKLTNKERLEQEGNLIDAETGKAISQEAGLILNLFHILKETDLVKVIEQAAQEVANGTGISKAVGDIMGEVKTTVLTAIGREVEGVEQTGDDIPSSGGDVQKPSETGTATPREDLTLDALTPEQEKAEQEKIKEQKRKRAEREEIEKRTAAPLKGDSGDLTSTLPSMEGTSDAPLFTENDRIGEQEKGGEKAEPAKTPDKQPEPEKKPTEAPTERKTEPETEQVVVTDGGEAFLEQWNEWLKEGRPPHKSPMGYGPDADAKTAVFEANVIALANRGKKLPDAQKADIRGTHKVTGDGIKLKAIKLKTPREAAAPITSKDTTRRALNGVYYDAENQLIVATDGPSAIAIPAEVKESKIVLVGKTVVEQRDLGKKNGEEIEGEYPNWKTIEPDVSHNHTSRKLDIEATRKSVTASSIVGNSYDNVSGVTNLGTEAIPRLVESDRLLRGITALLESGAKEITLHYNTDDLKHPVTLRADNGAKFILMPTRSKFLREGRAVAAAAYTTDPVFTPVKFKEPTDLNETPKLLGFMTAQELAKYPKRAGNYGVGFTDKVPFEKRLSDAIEEIKEYHKEGKYAKYVKDRLMSLERANKILESAGLPPMTISELTSTPQEQETQAEPVEEQREAPEPTRPVGDGRLTPELAKKLLSLGEVLATAPAGPAYRHLRQEIMSALEGKKVPVAKSGVTALEKALIDYFGVSTKQTGVGIRDDLYASLKRVANGEEQKTKTTTTPPTAPARTEFIARGTKVVGKDTDGVAYSGEIEAYNAADDTYTLNVLKVKQPGKAMLPLPIDAKTGNRQVLKKNLPADSVNPIDVNKGPSKLTEAEKRKLRIIDAARDSEIGANVDESISERLERVGGEEVQTPGDKDAAKYGNKSVTDNEIRFKITSPVEERGQLVAVHNLGIKQLEAVVNELGGFAMPSVAVTKPEIGHTEFGEVSVLFGKDTIDPAKSSYNKIYSGDAYTPSFPEVGVKMNEKAVIAVERRLSPLAKGNRMLNGTLHGMEDDIRRAGSPVEAYQYSPEMYALYAADRHGVEITPEMDMNALRSIRSDNPSYEDGYLGWLDETFKGTIVKKGFRNSKDTFAPSGARRSFEATHDPMTLANAVKIMRKKQQSGGQGGFFDTSVIGAARQPFKNIAQVKQAADQLTSIDDAEFNAQKRKVTDQWFDLASALDKENGFQGGFGGVTPVDIANAIAKSRDNPIRIRTFLRNLGYNKVSSELANDIAQLARDAAKVPTRYYEAKPARGVGLEEAKAVILPDSAPKSLVDALQKRGTHLEFYKADDKADRIRVLNQVADTVDNVRFKITPEVDAQQRDWAWKYRNGILPIEDKRAAEAIIDRINAARGLPDVVYHGSPTAAGLMKSGGFDVGKRGDLTRAPSARLADFFAGNKGTSAIYAALKLSEPMFGPWGTQPQNMNEVLGAVDDMVFGATYSGNRTQGDGSVQSSNPVFWNAYGEYIENVMAAKTAEQRRDLTIDFLNAEDPELRDSMIDAYEEELDRYTENSEQEAAEELYGDDIGDAWREDDDKRDEVYERAREYATNMVDAPKFLTRAPVTEKDLNISQFEWNPDNLPGTEGIERFAIDASKLKRIEYNKEGRNPTGSFAEHLEKAKQEGYEGVAFVDVKDGAGFDTVYALFENATRKSANPFTYDDKGELIPFSERAGDPTKDDIRYKITGDEVAAMWPEYFEDQEQTERLQALRGEREKFYSHENREITGIALDSSKATTEDFLRRVYKMGVETVQNRQADSEVVERSTNTFATEKGKLRALELVEEYASLDGQDLSQFNKRAPSVDERMLMFQLMRQHVFHLENASERFLRSEGAERNAIGQEMRALEGSLDRVITGLRVASTLAGRVLRNHQVGLDSLNMLVYRMARAEREKGAPLNEDEKREIMEKFRAYEKEHSRLTEELNQMEKQYQSERMAKEIAEREFAVAKEAIAKLAVTKTTTRKLQNLIEWEDGVMFKITPEQDAEYLAAVERGDMETAQRMVDEAAKAAGYNVGPVYHGTGSAFTVFDAERIGSAFGEKEENGFFFSSKFVADSYATKLARDATGEMWPSATRILSAHLSLKNPLIKDAKNMYAKLNPWEKNFDVSKAIKQARREGRDGVIIKRLNDLGTTKGFEASEGTTHWVVFNPSQIKSADAATYDDNGDLIPLSRRFDDARADIRYKITPDPMSLEEIQTRVSTGNMTPNQFIEAFVPEALARGYEIGEIESYLVDLATKKGGRVKKGVKQQQPQKPKQPIDPKKAKVPYNDKEGNPEPKKVAKYAWALALKEYGDIHGFELEEMSKEHLYGVIDNAVNIANEIMGVEIFDREQLIRLTTGYGKVTEKKRTEFDRALSKTRSMLLSLARINDLAYGNRAKKVETDRLKTVPLMRELAQEVLNMLDRGVATGILPDVDIETVKDVLNSRFDNMRRALKMAIQELAQAIERGTPTTRGEKQEYEDPPDIKELKRIKKELQAAHDAMPAVQERKKALYLQNRVTNLKKQISALDEKIEKAKQGVFETVEKKARPTTQEINDLTAERDGKKRELRELEANDLGQQAKRYEEAMKRLQEVGQQLTEALEAGETIPHKDTEPLTEKQLQLEARRRANTELRKQLRDNWALENEDAAERISLTRQLNTLLRQESRLQRLISDKDFQPRVTKDPPVNWQIIKKRNQIAALRSKYEMEARNLEYRMSGFKGKVKAHWETADTVARMWKTWADVSAFVQTGLLAAGHPILASRAFMDATSNAWSERHYIEFWQKIEQDPFYQAFIVHGGKAHQEVDVYQGGNAADVLVQTMKDSRNKVTSVVGQGIDMSQKHFNILVSMMRFYAFKSIVAGQNLDINNKEHAIQLKQIANMVNQLGGAGTMPGKNLKKAFWSSAMMAAQIATATGGAGIIYNATLKGEAGKRHVWYEATPGAWKEALRIHAGLLAANLLMNVFQMLLAKLSGDDDPELGDWEGLQTDSTWDMMWRLYSRTFGPQKVGKTNILINGAYPILRLMHETAKTLTDYDTETSKTRKIGGELARFASGRANPLMSDIVQLLLGRDYMGEPYGPMIFPKLFENKFAKDEKKVTWGDVGQGMVNMTINTLVPLAQRDLIETTVDVAEEFGIFGLMAAPVTMSLAMMGWAKSTYPVSHTRQRFEVEKIMRDYERIKKEGTREQQAEYRERYGWVVRNEKGFKSHIKRMRDARKSGDEDKIRETGRDFYHYYIEKTERSGVGALW